MPDIRDLYSQPIDFQALALQDKDFAQIFTSGHVNFKDAASVQQVCLDLAASLVNGNQAIVNFTFETRFRPPGRIPNRLKYILWLQDLIDSTGPNLDNVYDADRQVTGLDIGTGSSCIYPLLGCSLRPRWRFLATDIDNKNIHYAEENVQRNSFDNRIKIWKANHHGPLIPLDDVGIERLDFVMTNPPFYTSREELVETAAKKSQPPFSACTGAEIEMVTEGGEAAFVKRVFEESRSLATRVQWFSAMLGKLESAREIVSLVTSTEKDATQCTTNFAVKELVQGTKTRRWVVAWSWQSRRPAVTVARGTLALGKQNLPFPSLVTLDFTTISHPDDASTRLDTLMSSISSTNFRWDYDTVTRTGTAYAMKNAWSRAARRAKAKDMDLDRDHEIDIHQEPALIVKISIVRAEKSEFKAISLDLSWLLGKDSVLFESFCGMVKREMS